jgi:hypothetical protein
MFEYLVRVVSCYSGNQATECSLAARYSDLLLPVSPPVCSTQMGSALTLGLAGWLALRGQGTVGVAYTFLSYTFNLSFALTQLSSITGEGPADLQDIAASRCTWALFVSLPVMRAMPLNASMIDGIEGTH